VSIHCFPNGNGRHSRLLADTYISHMYGRKVFSWGKSMLVRKSEARKQYIEALRKADEWDIGGLVAFARG
jgi:fido (protein-threonine AMPylation protein)